MKNLQPYHYAWLTTHPERTKDWLRFMMKAGFDIHHLDGNHENNTPDNLVLIEHRDHMRLHGATSGFARELETTKKRRKQRFMAEGENAYTTAVAIQSANPQMFGFEVWNETAKQHSLKHGSEASNRARLWAKTHNLAWPLFHKAARTKAGLVA